MKQQREQHLEKSQSKAREEKNLCTHEKKEVVRHARVKCRLYAGSLKNDFKSFKFLVKEVFFELHYHINVSLSDLDNVRRIFFSRN